MANMSYCRFQNTAMDLNDCMNALDSFENEYTISPDECRAGIRMIDKFLGWCMDEGLIDGYERDDIEKLFNDHNMAVQDL